MLSSSTGRNQRPQVARVNNNQLSLGLAACSKSPPSNPVHTSTSATARRAPKRRMSSILIPCRHPGRYRSPEENLRHRDHPFRAYVRNVDTKSVEGAWSERNAAMDGHRQSIGGTRLISHVQWVATTTAEASQVGIRSIVTGHSYCAQIGQSASMQRHNEATAPVVATPVQLRRSST